MYFIKPEYLYEQFHTPGNIKNKAYLGKSLIYMLIVPERYSGKASKSWI